MKTPLFVAGTDTEVGKTFVTERLVRFLRQNGQDCLGIKPIASDSQFGTLESQKHPAYSGLVNSDAKSLFEANDETLSYSEVNPVVFQEAIAPHIAAEKSNTFLSVETLDEQVSIPEVEQLLIEGAGGWSTPLNRNETYADWVAKNEFDVILVVGMKLGCLNHAQLTAQAIRSSGLKLKGWVANEIIPDMPFFDDNIQWLHDYFLEQHQAPLLAKVSYQQPLSEFSLLQAL